MAGQRIPGPIGTDTEPTVRIDSGTLARMATPPPGGICSTPDDGLKGPAYTLDLHALGWVDSVRAAQVMGRALNESWDHVARIVRQETDVVIDALVDLILPILALGIAVLVAGVVFSGGVFALGLALLEWLGLGFLAVEIGCALAVVGGYTSRGARRAVNSLFVLPHQRSEELTLAATDFARAQAELIKAVLMGIVALLLKNSAVTSSRKAGLPELLATVRKSRLGEGFAVWLESNWQALAGNSKLRPPVQRSAAPTRTAEVFTPSQLARGRPDAMAETPPAAIAAATFNPVKTAPDTAFFWSGRTGKIGGAENAARIAAERGGTTLETLLEQRKIQMPAWDAADPKVVQAWQSISAQYAEGASGTVRAVVGQSLRPGNVWETAELPALMKNPAVRRIITIDPATGVETTVFTRGAGLP